MNAPSAVETRTERVWTSPSEGVDISPQTDQPREYQSVPAVVGPTTLNIEVRTQRNDVESNEENAYNIPPSQMSKSVRPSLLVDDLLLSRNVPQGLSIVYNPPRDSQIRTQDINIGGISSILPVEGGISSNDRQIVPENRSNIPYYPHEGIHPQRTSTTNRRDSSDHSSDESRLQRGRGYANERGRPQRERERDTQAVTEDLQGEEDYPVMEDHQIDMEEDHLREEDYLMEEDHLMEEDPLMMEDHLMVMEAPKTSK